LNFDYHLLSPDVPDGYFSNYETRGVLFFLLDWKEERNNASFEKSAKLIRKHYTDEKLNNVYILVMWPSQFFFAYSKEMSEFTKQRWPVFDVMPNCVVVRFIRTFLKERCSLVVGKHTFGPIFNQRKSHTVRTLSTGDTQEHNLTGFA